MLLNKEYTRRARDGFLKLAGKKYLMDNELWILVQATAQYLGLVEAHRELRKKVSRTKGKYSSKSSRGLDFVCQIIDVVGEKQDPVKIESRVLYGNPIKSPYGDMTDALFKSISDGVQYRRRSEKPADWFLEVKDNRKALPKGLEVLTYSHALVSRWPYADGLLLKAKIYDPCQYGIIVCGVYPTGLTIQEYVVVDPQKKSYITQYFETWHKGGWQFAFLEYKTPKPGCSGDVIGCLWIDLRANPNSLDKIISLMAGYEYERFVDSGGAFNRRDGVSIYTHLTYRIPKADIFRVGS